MDETTKTSQTPTPAGTAIREWLERDHARLDVLLSEGVAADGTVNREAYDEFRRGLLRHINIEEKILYPAALKIAAVDRAARLRLDHGAMGAMLVLDPSPAVRHAIASILSVHNPLEEGDVGVYEQCIEILGDATGALLADIERSPEVPLATRAQTDYLLNAAKRCLVRAGYDGAMLDPDPSK